MSDQDRSNYDRGWEVLSHLSSDVRDRLINSLKDVSPDFARMVIEFPFGQVYARPGITIKERELISISVLATLGNAKIQFQDHVRCGLKVGLTQQEITEALIQLSVFAGFPVALNSLFLAQEVFEEV